MKYVIADSQLDNLTKKLSKIQRKCSALNLPFSFKIGEATEIKYVRNFGAGFAVTFRDPAHEVEVEGVAKINGWTFVAKICHEAGGNVICNAPDMECPAEYRDAKPHCDHCHSERHRNETFVIVSENGEYKQVGKSCLKLYTNGLDADACADYASIAHLIDGFYKGHHPNDCKYVTTVSLVCACNRIVKEKGYTKENVSNNVFHYLFEDVQYKQEDIDEAKRIIDSIASYQGDGDYLLNVRNVLSAEYVDWYKWDVLVASYVVYLQRQEAKKAIQKSKSEQSEHVGEVGKRQTFKIQRVNGDFYRMLYVRHGDYGNVYVLEMIDVDGNVLKWSASHYYWLEEARETDKDVLTVKATVKAHDEYRGVKQTVVQRVALDQ